jgi:outer membrane protein W
MSKSFRNTLPIAFALLASASFAHAQTGLDVFAGAGTASTSSSGQKIDTFGTGTPFTTPSLSGVFGRVGADYMFKPWIGVGAETDWRFSQGAYAGLNYRPLFYDFNVIWTPTAKTYKRIVPELQAGIGGTKLSFYENSSYCNAFAGCSSNSAQVASSNHFQTHLEAGIRFYATQHFFIRPQIDAHYVNNFFQFGSNWVPEYGASVGWSFGER